MLKRVPIYTIKVIYKSGATHTFDAYSFELNNGVFRWDNVTPDNKPLILGVDEIAAVWQVGTRYGWRRTK